MARASATKRPVEPFRRAQPVVFLGEVGGLHRDEGGHENGVEPCAYLRDLFTKLVNRHLARDIDALMPWAYTNGPFD